MLEIVQSTDFVNLQLISSRLLSTFMLVKNQPRNVFELWDITVLIYSMVPKIYF